jgi:multidrug efflux system outer membrane protein
MILRPRALHRTSLLAAFSLTLAVAGCAVGPEPRAPSVDDLGAPAAYLNDVPPRGATTADLVQWWSAFDDATLDEFVARALTANADLEAAGARGRAARAALSGTSSALWPSIGLGVTATRRELSTLEREGSTADRGGSVTSYDAGIDASYEVDLFGGVRRSVTASRADFAATAAASQSTRITVAAEVALNYVDARLAQRRLAIARANLAAQDETLQIVDWRVLAGLVGSLDLEQARRLRAQTAAAVPAVEQTFAAAVNRLAVLLAWPVGDVQQRLLANAEAAVPLAPLPVAGIPAESLRRRPDVLAAEQSVVAEVARIGVREADLYPALRLTGSFGGSSTSFSDVADDALGTLVASLTAPLFEGGRLRAAVAQQRAIADAAVADYRGTLLAAVEETENALVSADVAERREVELVVAEEAARNAAVLARSQYQAGLIDFQTLLDTERSLLTTEDSRATARADRAAASVRLFKALGGGWDPAAPASP